MKYTVTKRRYIDSIFLLLVGTVGLVALGLYIKPIHPKKNPPIKPVISIAATNRFLYVANVNQKSTATIFQIDPRRTNTIYSTPSGNFTNGSLLNNHLFYLHGNENIGMNIDTKKFFTNNGDYISPDGKKFLSIDTSGIYRGLLVFSLLDEHNTKTLIKTQNTTRQVDKLLGWSPDSNNFYYTIPYSITKQASQSAVDHWTQRVSKNSDKTVEMSRVRTWVKYSTSSGEMVFAINTQDKIPQQVFANSRIGTIHQAFYNNKTDTFYLENDTGLYSANPGYTTVTQIPLAPKIATASSSIVFSDDENRFMHSEGTGIYITDSNAHTTGTLFYASNSAVVTPLAFSGDNVIFTLQDNNFFSGEMIDVKRYIRTEFFHQPLDPSITQTPSLSFVSWIKNIKVTF